MGPRLLIVLALAIAAVSEVKASEASGGDEGCGAAEKIRVKGDWAKAYGSGQKRADFTQAVWDAFLKQHPANKRLFGRVNVENIRSAEFRAHMARVFGGVDILISVLDDPKVLESELKHYSKFHTKYGLLPYVAFGDSIALVLESNLGKPRFAAEAWKKCFKLIGKKMGAAARIRQSPINLLRTDTEFSAARVPWAMTYPTANTKNMVNNGHTVQVNFEPKGTELSGGPLGTKKFCLQQFHFHWGSKDSRGSEHTVHGYAYPAEMHLVHWNCERYSSFAEAIPSEDGLTVLGVFLQVDNKANPTLKSLTDLFGKIQYKGQSVDVEPFDPSTLLPANTNAYWFYPGSLTTPPYSETVNWVVFEYPIYITEKMLEEFRHLYSFEEGKEPEDTGHGHHRHIEDNFRATQDLFGRDLKATFH